MSLVIWIIPNILFVYILYLFVAIINDFFVISGSSTTSTLRFLRVLFVVSRYHHPNYTCPKISEAYYQTIDFTGYNHYLLLTLHRFDIITQVTILLLAITLYPS